MAAGLAIALAEGVMGKLGEIAAEKALNEASLLLHFKNDFKWLEKKLRMICAALEAADEQSEHKNHVKEWLADVRNIAYDAQDIIDECDVEHLYTNTSQSWFCSYFQLILSSISQSIFQYQMGKRIKELKDRISSTVQEAQELKLFHEVAHISQPSTSTSERERERERGAELRRWSILEKDSPAVAIEHKVEEFLRLLDNPAVGVVAVVGMGGLGKTFLLQHVYNSSKYRYDCSAWISISQTCSLRKLQYDLASNVHVEIDNVSDVRAAELIHEGLEGKRCLIVLYDVWRSSVEGNLIFRLGLPSGRNNQVKIVITTRSRDVAEDMSASIYEMQHLSEDESWNLFSLFAFPDREGNRPPKHLESLARQIVEKCGRLPLAVKTVAASMAKSSLTSEWESKLGQLKKVGNAKDSTMKILKLSYDSLPPNLKSCFAYFSFFPDTKISFTSLTYDGYIHQDYVIDLWMAEGFIPQVEDREQWDIGLDYLHQLQNLCLVDIDRVRSCYTIHDLLLDLAVNICKEHECVFDLPLEETSCRRLLVAKKGIATNAISERPIHRQRFLRTLSFSHNPEITSIPRHLFDHVRLLRVIDFSRTAISTLPKSVGNLKLVKVLNLSHTQVREVPDCVRRLKTLQFLDVSWCRSLTRLPHWIGDLKCLSNLNVEWCSLGHSDNMPKGISQLSSLRRLRSGYILLSTKENELNFKDVGNLFDLQEIGIRFKDVRGLTSIEDGVLERLVKMRALGVWNGIPAVEGDTGESTLPVFPEKLNVMKDLHQLYLARFSVPSWICGMENLTELSLRDCSDYPSLQKMRNLQSLYLRGNSKCTELPKNFGESGGFPKLVRLDIEDFPLLEELPALEEEAMPHLEGLVIWNCPRVKKVPEGLERLSRLKRIVVKQASGELEERLKKGGEDWKRIKANNPHIQIIVGRRFGVP